MHNLTIWFTSGKTARFKDVHVKACDEHVLKFTYTSASRGVGVKGSFKLDMIAGYAIDKEEER